MKIVQHWKKSRKLALVCFQYILKTEVKSYFLGKAFLSDARQQEPTPFPIGCVQTDATTPNIVAPTMLGVVACVWAVVCKQMQQLPTMLGPTVHRGKDTTHKSL